MALRATLDAWRPGSPGPCRLSEQGAGAAGSGGASSPGVVFSGRMGSARCAGLAPRGHPGGGAGAKRRSSRFPQDSPVPRLAGVSTCAGLTRIFCCSCTTDRGNPRVLLLLHH